MCSLAWNLLSLDGSLPTRGFKPARCPLLNSVRLTLQRVANRSVPAFDRGLGFDILICFLSLVSVSIYVIQVCSRLPA